MKELSTRKELHQIIIVKHIFHLGENNQNEPALHFNAPISVNSFLRRT